MRIGSLVVGVIAILVGGVFTLQGAGALPGSFMTGQRMWLIIGIIVAVVGLALAYNGIRRPTRS
jgi:amino acid transporter